MLEDSFSVCLWKPAITSSVFDVRYSSTLRSATLGKEELFFRVASEAVVDEVEVANEEDASFPESSWRVLFLPPGATIAAFVSFDRFLPVLREGTDSVSTLIGAERVDTMILSWFVFQTVLVLGCGGLGAWGLGMREQR